MSIASEITRITTNIANAYGAINTKGGTLPVSETSANLASAIATIPQIMGITREVTAQGVYQIPQSNFTFSTPSNALDLGPYALWEAFKHINSYSTGTDTLVGVDLSSLTKISGQRAPYDAFYACQYCVSANFANLEEVSGKEAFKSAFYNNGITAINYPKLKYVTGANAFEGAFSGCPLASDDVTFAELLGIGEDIASGSNSEHFRAFAGTNKVNMYFPKLQHIYATGPDYGTFYGANVKKYYFPALTYIDSAPSFTGTSAAQNYIFANNTYLTELHFAAANQTAIEASSGYSAKWGAPAGCTVYFDL